MLELDDLAVILAVSREWSETVRSMAPINAAIQRRIWRLKSMKKKFRPLPPVARIVASPLLRHIASIHISGARGVTPLDNASLGLLAQHAPNLQSL